MNGRSFVVEQADLAAESAGLGSHAHFNPKARKENHLGKLRFNFEIRPPPHLRHRKIVQGGNAQITGNPRAVDDEGDRRAIHRLPPRASFDNIPLLLVHGSRPSVSRRERQVKKVTGARASKTIAQTEEVQVQAGVRRAQTGVGHVLKPIAKFPMRAELPIESDMARELKMEA